MKKMKFTKISIIALVIYLILTSAFVGVFAADDEGAPPDGGDQPVAVQQDDPAPASEPPAATEPEPEPASEPELPSDDGVVDEDDGVIEDEDVGVVIEEDVLAELVLEEIALFVAEEPEIGTIIDLWVDAMKLYLHCMTYGGNGTVLATPAFESGWYRWQYLGEVPGIGKYCWLLLDNDHECSYFSPGNPGCGCTEWIMYSNQSAVPDGKNYQLTHIGTPNPPTPYANASICGEKSVEIPSGVEIDSVTFEFNCVELNSADPNDVKTGGRTRTATTDGTGSFQFDFNYLEEGTYWFCITETVGDAGGWTYDTSTYVVKVVVTVNSDNVASARVDYPGKHARNVCFLNKYTPPPPPPIPFTNVAINGQKVVTGDTAPYTVVFTFNLVELNSANPNDVKAGGRTDTKTTNGAGLYQFDLNNLKEGTYWFRITETAGNLTGWTFDASVHVVKIVVSVNSDNIASAVPFYPGGDTKVVFVNNFKKTTIIIPNDPTPTSGGVVHHTVVPRTGDPGVAGWTISIIVAAILLGALCTYWVINNRKSLLSSKKG